MFNNYKNNNTIYETLLESSDSQASTPQKYFSKKN